MSRADLMLGGQSVGVAGVPILNPLLTLSAFNFDVFKVRPAHPTQCRVFIIRQTPHASIIASAARHFYGPLLKSEPLIKPLAYMQSSHRHLLLRYPPIQHVVHMSVYCDMVLPTGISIAHFTALSAGKSAL